MIEYSIVRRILVIIILIVVISSDVMGLQWKSFDVDFTFSWQYNAEIGLDVNRKQPDIFLMTIGASAIGDFDGTPGGFYLRPGGFFSWGTEEVYLGIARPTDEANIGNMKTLGLMADSHFGYIFQVNSVDIGLQLGPSAYLRFPISKAKNGTGNPDDFWKAYYAQGEFFYFGLGTWVSIATSGGVNIVIGLRVYQPISNLWTDVPTFHGAQAGLTISSRFDLSK